MKGIPMNRMHLLLIGILSFSGCGLKKSLHTPTIDVRSPEQKDLNWPTIGGAVVLTAGAIVLPLGLGKDAQLQGLKDQRDDPNTFPWKLPRESHIDSTKNQRDLLIWVGVSSIVIGTSIVVYDLLVD